MQDQAPQAPQLPLSLRNNVACLQVPNEEAPGGTTHVYVLGMSHVSKKSVDQVGVRIQRCGLARQHAQDHVHALCMCVRVCVCACACVCV